MRDDHPDPQLDLDLLGRYLEGRASAHEAEAVERWMAADARRREALEELRWVWYTEGHARHPRFDARRAWAGLPYWVRAGFRPPETALPAQSQRRWARPLAAAAALVLTAGLGVWYAERRPEPAAPHEVAYTTQRGELRSFTLDDGTRVFLGAASRLRAPVKFGTERVVTLEGEAYFDVVHDAARPFRVQAAGLVVQDIGTSFSVRAFPASAVREVAVRSGKVAVTPAVSHSADSTHHATLLAPGMLLRVSGERLMVARADTNSYFAWTTGRLVFEDRPLREVIEELERWYKLTIVLEDATLASGHITATFGPQSRAEIVSVLAGAVGARAQQHGDTAVFKRAGRGRGTVEMRSER